MNYIDLHTHTTASDGTLTPEQLVTEAAALALEVIAITDHDTIAGLAEGLSAGPLYRVEVIPGVEINTARGSPAKASISPLRSALVILPV